LVTNEREKNFPAEAYSPAASPCQRECKQPECGVVGYLNSAEAVDGDKVCEQFYEEVILKHVSELIIK